MYKEFKPYIDNIIREKKILDEKIAKLKSAKNIDDIEYFAKDAIQTAVFSGTSYYASSEIENIFLKIAQDNLLDKMPQNFKKNSFLHVMTDCYETGGHTRVVERWIELSPDEQKHSLVFTGLDTPNALPKRLENAIKDKNGCVYKVNVQQNIIEKGLELRKIASEYEYIILHVHMQDFLPIIAFGNEQFNRPVIFYNHADHMFWLGVSIADIVADLRIFGKEISDKKRGVKNNFILGIPVDSKEVARKNKTDLRKILNLPIDKKIILTVGAAHKYKPIAGIDFLTPVLKVMERDKDVLLLGIGPSFEKLPNWEIANTVTDNRIIALGEVPHGKLFDYFQASDLAIDSFPMCGGTAMIDAVSNCCPVITRDNPVGLFDYIKNSDAYCENIEKMPEKILELLYDNQKIKANIESVTYQLQKNNSAQAWKQNLHKLVENTPKEHKINDFKENTDEISDLDFYHYFINYRTRKKKSFIQKIFKIDKKFNFRVVTVLGKEFIFPV